MLGLALLIVLAGLWPPAQVADPGPGAAPAAGAEAGPAAVTPPAPRIAHDLKDRTQVWQAHVGYVRAATVVGAGLVGDLILVEDSDHGATALDPATGAMRWFVQLPGRLAHWPAAGDEALVLDCGTELIVVNSSGRRLRSISTASIAADSPVSDGRLAYIPSLLHDRLVAVDLQNGVTDWEFGMRSGFTAPALLLGDLARRSVVVSCADGSMRAIPAGLAVPTTERWVAHVGALVGPPVTDGRRIYANSTERAIVALDAGVGTIVWRSLSGDPLVGKPVLGAGLLFAGTTSHLIALDAATGAMRWQHTSADRPLGANGAVLLVGRDDASALLDPADGHELATGLPRDVFIAGKLLVELQSDSSLLATQLSY